MWKTEVFGTDVYHLMAAFCIYSILGWVVESIYMSVCNRRLTNRGFAKGPYCPIYGVGAVTGYLILHPFADSYVVLYCFGALIATLFEFLVGKLMIRIFGQLWWDYKDKPCNYKGIICLESTVAWGFYACIIIMFLHKFVLELIDSYSYDLGVRILQLIILVFAVDFLVQLIQALGIDVKEQKGKLIEKYNSFKARWY